MINNTQTLLVITSYPNPALAGERDFNAVGWHSEQTLQSLSKIRPVLVFAQKIGKSKSFKVNKNLDVQRVWEKGSISSLIALFFRILKLQQIKTILVQFEFNIFGGILPNITLLAALFILKLLGRQITFELHQVILDIKLLEKHIHITNFLSQKFFNLGIRIFYLLLGFSVSKIIVFEQELKERLSDYIKSNKIYVLPLFIQEKKAVDNLSAKKILSLDKKEFIILLFGFINGYKGIDWTINQFKVQNAKFKANKVRLLIAGGENPYLKDKPHYQAFYQSIIKEAKKCPSITLAGFVPDEQIPLYFGASDLVVLPYEVFMSASGPFAHALSYGKPIVLSEKLLDYQKSPDFKQALKSANLLKTDIFFSLKDNNLIKLIKKAKDNKKYYHKLIYFSQTLANMRLNKNIIYKMGSLLSERENPSQTVALCSN